MPKRIYIADPEAGLITIRDPMILVHEGRYYLTGTQPPYWEGPNDGVHLWSSPDLEHFTDHGLILRRADMPEEMWCRDRFWAPELFRSADGWFYLTFNCKNNSKTHPHPLSVGLARSRAVTGPYQIVTRQKPLCEGNDGTLFQDEDGQLYLGCNAPGELLIHKLDPENGTLSDTITVCRTGPEGAWDAIGVEGQCILKRHGIYFQWYSSWTNGYEAGVLTARDIAGPWTKHPTNPILRDGPILHRQGHNHCFTGPDGRDYLSFHAQLREPDGEDLERMVIRPVEYLRDGNVLLK